uniref:Uncharacterized protein n=1 Tax=Mus musculus TaxID=10090 RepID=Q3U140_MOUSE|nr:unnamed protein product [Mus musculus]
MFNPQLSPIRMYYVGIKIYQISYCEESESKPEGDPHVLNRWRAGGRAGGRDVCGEHASTCVISQSASYCLFNMKCRHSVPAITCPFQPLTGADLCCPL